MPRSLTTSLTPLLLATLALLSSPSRAQDVAPPVPEAPVAPDVAPAPVPEVAPSAPAPSAPAPSAPAPSPGTPARVRIFVAPFSGATSDPATVDLVEDRVLVAARSAAGDQEVIGARDVQSILDVEAAKAAAGCDATSCANEIADALSADEIVFGQLGRIGDTWQLTLTRTHRATLRVLGRAVREASGDTPEGLLDGIGAQVAEVFGVVEEGPSTLSVIGMGATGLGVAGLAFGGAAYAYSWIAWNDAFTALQPASRNVEKAKQHEADGRAALVVAYVAGGVGAAVTAVGAGLWIAGGVE